MRTKTINEKLTQKFHVSNSNVTAIAPAVFVLFLTLLKSKGGET
jgi:hypothetical protein